MLRSILAALILTPAAFSQSYPSFRWIKEVDSSGKDSFAGLGVDGQGNTYLAGSNYQANSTALDVYVFKLDQSGNIAYSKHLGGTGDDVATAMTVDQSGDVYVAGTTNSTDFPVTSGAFASKGTSFLFKLNPDGSTAYATYFASVASPVGIAVDGSGSAYLAGNASDGLPVTQGAYQSSCSCTPSSNGFFEVITQSGFVSKFKPDGSGLTYSTYVELGQLGPILTAMALAPDASVYVGGQYGIYHLDATGSMQLNTSTSVVGPQAMMVASDGSLYVAGPLLAPIEGSKQTPPTIPGAFESNPEPFSTGQTIALVEKLDSKLAGVTASTYFGGPLLTVQAMTMDKAGDVYIGGFTGPQGLPTRTPIQGGFNGVTGFVSELSGDLTSLLFSSYFGDLELFGVKGVGIAPDGSLLLGGATGPQQAAGSGPMNLWANSIALTTPPAFRIDSAVNAASMTDGAISAGETIVIQGAGFTQDSLVSIGGIAVTPLTIAAGAIAAVVPQNVPAVAAEVIVSSGAASSNPVLMPVSAVSPGIFSQSGAGVGQGYILNQDGTLNTPSNPAKPNQKITIFANGVGPIANSGGYAVTQFPVNVFVDGFYADGVAAVTGPVQGLPGNVYQITVIVPNPASFASFDSSYANFSYPPQVSIGIQVDGVSSPLGLQISLANR